MAKIRIQLLKDALIDDHMYGKESVVEMTDVQRVKFMIGMNIAAVVSDAMPLTMRPPPPKPARTAQANEIGEVIAEALRKGLIGVNETQNKLMGQTPSGPARS